MQELIVHHYANKTAQKADIQQLTLFETVWETIQR